jgi:hypothetical protein
VIKLRGGGRDGMPKNLSCDCSTRFMKVILLGLSLVSTSLQYWRSETGLQYKYSSTTDPSKVLCESIVKLYRSCVHRSTVKLCTVVQYIFT